MYMMGRAKGHRACDSYKYLSPHCTLRYDAAVEAIHLYAHAVKVVLLDAPSLLAGNGGASFLAVVLSFQL
jgi:hypothetical protein